MAVTFVGSPTWLLTLGVRCVLGNFPRADQSVVTVAISITVVVRHLLLTVVKEIMDDCVTVLLLLLFFCDAFYTTEIKPDSSIV